MTNVCTPFVSASVLFSVKYIGSYGICTVLCVNEFHSPFLFYILGTFSDFNVEFFCLKLYFFYLKKISKARLKADLILALINFMVQ